MNEMNMDNANLAKLSGCSNSDEDSQCNSTLDVDRGFKEVKAAYTQLRESEHRKLRKFLKEEKILFETGLNKSIALLYHATKGSKQYRPTKINGKKQKAKHYDLSDWRWIRCTYNKERIFTIYLQAFDTDADTKNRHILMDRIQIRVHAPYADMADVYYTTDFDLPLCNSDLVSIKNLLLHLWQERQSILQ